MIGKPVSSEEFQRILNKQRENEKFLQEFDAELRAIKPGECLMYEAPEGKESVAGFSLSLTVSKIKGLRLFTEGRKSYVYREKG